MERLSILLLNPLGERDWGGVETWMRSVARGLADRGHALRAAARKESRFLARFREEGFPVATLAFRRDFGPLDVLKLRRLLRRGRVDVVLTKLDRGIRAAGLASALGGGAAVVMRQGLYEVKEGFRHRLAYRWVDRVITPALLVAERIAASGIVPPDRVVHVPNGVDAKRFAPDPGRGRALRAERGIPAGPLLLMTSRLHDQKGHEVAIEALAALPADARLAIAGTGRREGELRARADGAGVGARVHFLGHLDDVADLLRAGDLFLLSSHFEGMPNNLLEAMAAGLAVVASAVGDVPLMVEDGVTGLLVPPGDPAALARAAARLLADSHLRRSLGEAARAAVRARYPVSAMVDGTERCLRDAVEQRRAGAVTSGRTPRRRSPR